MWEGVGYRGKLQKHQSNVPLVTGLQCVIVYNQPTVSSPLLTPTLAETSPVREPWCIFSLQEVALYPLGRQCQERLEVALLEGLMNA